MTDGGFRTAVDGDVVVVRLPDPRHAATAVTLWCDLELGHTRLAPVDGGWELELSDLPVDRLEYLLDVDGDLRPDPTHDRRVGGPFGEHSWVVLPGYRQPCWLDERVAPGEQAPVLIEDTPVGDVEVTVWAPADADGDDPLPMLYAHDGPEMAAYGGLLDYVATGIATGRLPRMRVAMLAPGPRDERYAANPAYTAALVDHVVPALTEACPTDARPVLTGQSLGGVAALHAAWTTPGLFGGLLLQSGSFFTPELDPQESDFAHWDEVTGFVATVHAATRAAPGAPLVAMTCGSAEENLANNRLLRDHLATTGVEVTWAQARQGHTWTCWRDLLDPALTELLRKVWG